MSASESKKFNVITEEDETDKELDKAVDQICLTDIEELDTAVDEAAIDHFLWEAFKNCTLYENSIEMYKHNDVRKLLDTVGQWDIDIKNQYNRLQKFDCLECHFKTIKFNDWKYHITSISHMTICYNTVNLYSYICFKKHCKMLLYGSYESLNNHMKDKHKDKFAACSISILMEEVMKRYIICSQKPLYFCFHCTPISDTPIHPEGTVFRSGIKFSIDYYCKTCKVMFTSTPDMIDYHSLSVEHMTIKCFNMFGITAKTNVKNIIPSEQPNQNRDSYGPQSVQNNTTKLPMIILNKFEDINGLKWKCKLCNSFIIFNDKSILNHLSNCNFKCDLKGKNKTTVKVFMCFVCDCVTDHFNTHKGHFTSYLHLTNCQNTDNFYSYVCHVCNVYMYGHKIDIINHWKLNHDDTIIRRLPILFTFMSKIFNDFNKNPNIVKTTHYYSDNEPSDSTTIVPYPCVTCKIEFNNVDDYNMHAITSEHIILKFLTPKKIVEYSDTLKSICYEQPTEEIPVIQNSPLLQNHENSKDDDEKNVQNVQINESQTNENCTALLNYDEPQKIFDDVEFAKENYNDSFKFNTKMDVNMRTNHSKQEYMKHFIVKMVIAKVWKEFKMSNIHVISYYCNICDKIETTERLWDEHYNINHSDDSNTSTIYCSTCCLYIFGSNVEDHYSTIEHCDYLRFINILNPVEDVTESVNSDKYEMLTNHVEDQQIELNNTCAFNGTSVSSCSKVNIWTKIEHILDEQEQPDKNDNLVMTNHFFDTILDQNDKAENIISREITSTSNDSLDTPTSIHQLNRDENIKETMDCKDMSVFSDDSVPFNFVENTKEQEEIIDEKPILESVFTKMIVDIYQLLENIKTLHEYKRADEEYIYGEYVAQRLKYIKNPIVRQNIKLEIDKIFYANIEKLSEEN